MPKGRYAAAQWAAEQTGTGASMEFSDEMDSESSKNEGKSDGEDLIGVRRRNDSLISLPGRF